MYACTLTLRREKKGVWLPCLWQRETNERTKILFCNYNPAIHIIYKLSKLKPDTYIILLCLIFLLESLPMTKVRITGISSHFLHTLRSQKMVCSFSLFLGYLRIIAMDFFYE